MTIDRIRAWAMSQPDKTAVINNGLSYSYASFSRAIEASRRFLSQFDLPIGKTAVVMVNDLFDGWCLTFALRAIGLNTIVVRSIAQAEELKVKNVACVVITQSERNVHALSGKILAGVTVIIVPSSVYASIHTGVLPDAPSDSLPVGGHILYTSGTTGTHKKILFDGEHEEFRNAARGRDLALGTAATHHNLQYGLWTGVGFKQPAAVWHSGGAVVFETNALGENTINVSRFFQHGITSATVTPMALKAIVDAIVSGGIGLIESRTLSISITGGFVPTATLKLVVERITPDLVTSYGSTELGHNAMESRYKKPQDFYWFSPSFDRVVQIVDENGNECGIDREGELRVLTTDLDAKSYLDDEETSARFFRNGYFYPGDVAIRRSDGRIRILGRVDDVLNLHGSKIAVAPLEADIQRALGVDGVCLFSRLNDHGEEELAIAIESDRSVSNSDLQAIARQFSGFQVVRCVTFKSFPRVDTGMQKVKRTALRQMVLAPTNKQ